MLAPGLTIVDDRVLMADQAPDYVGNGVGWVNGGALAITLAPVVNAHYNGGLAFTADVRLYVTETLDASDVYLSGLRVSVLGALVVAGG